MSMHDVLFNLFARDGLEEWGAPLATQIQEELELHLAKSLPGWEYDKAWGEENPRLRSIRDPAGREYSLKDLGDLDGLPPALQKAVKAFLPRFATWRKWWQLKP